MFSRGKLSSRIPDSKPGSRRKRRPRGIAHAVRARSHRSASEHSAALRPVGARSFAYLLFLVLYFQRKHFQFLAVNDVHRWRSALWTGKRLKRTERPFTIALSAEDHDGNVLDNQL